MRCFCRVDKGFLPRGVRDGRHKDSQPYDEDKKHNDAGIPHATSILRGRFDSQDKKASSRVTHPELARHFQLDAGTTLMRLSFIYLGKEFGALTGSRFLDSARERLYIDKRLRHHDS